MTLVARNKGICATRSLTEKSNIAHDYSYRALLSHILVDLEATKTRSYNDNLPLFLFRFTRGTRGYTVRSHEPPQEGSDVIYGFPFSCPVRIQNDGVSILRTNGSSWRTKDGCGDIGYRGHDTRSIEVFQSFNVVIGELFILLVVCATTCHSSNNKGIILSHGER